MSYVMLVLSHSHTCGHRPHWLGPRAAEWLPGLTSVLLCHCQRAQSSVTISDPDYGHQTSSWFWSSSSFCPWPGKWFFQLDLGPASDMFHELDSWWPQLPPVSMLCSLTRAVLPGWDPGSYRAASPCHALTFKPLSLCLGSSWMVTMVHNLWYPLYYLLRKFHGQPELYHTAVALCFMGLSSCQGFRTVGSTPKSCQFPILTKLNHS